jgi:hypothetical protein
VGGGEAEDKWERRMGICLGGGWGAEDVGASCSLNALGNQCYLMCCTIQRALACQAPSATCAQPGVAGQ